MTDPRPTPRWPRPGWLLLAPVLVAVLAFGGVHPGVRAVGALGAGAVLVFVVAGARKAPSTGPLGLAAVLGGAGLWLVGGLRLVPLPDRLRPALQGELGGLVQASHALVGADSGPLAVDLPAAVDAWGSTAGVLALGLAAALLLRTRRRRLELAGGLVGLAVLLVLLAAGHRALGLDQIWGISGLPRAAKEPAFGTFINPNHGGVLVAAALPVAVALATRRHQGPRLLAGAGALVCLAGLGLAQSRGALIAGALGLTLTLTLALPRQLGLALGGTAVLAGGVGLGLGIERVVDGLTSALLPGQATPHALGSRPEIWRHTVALARAAAPSGVGPGGFSDALPAHTTGGRFAAATHAHQELLQALAEQGPIEGPLWVLLVLLPLGLGLARVLRLERGRRRWLGAGLLGGLSAVLVAGLWGFPLRTQALAMVVAVLSGALVGLDAQSARRPALARLALPAAGAVLLMGCVVPAAGWVWARLDPEAPTRGPTALLALDDAGAADGAALAAAVRWQPLDWRVVVQLARHPAATGDTAAALRTTAQARRLAPSLPWPHILEARLRARTGEQTLARLAWRRALSRNLPDNDRAQPWLEAAIADTDAPLLELAAVVPERADRLRDAARIAAERGDPWTARSFSERAVALDPAMAAPYARFLLGAGDTQDAARMLALVPLALRGDCGVLATRGEVTLAVGDPAEALALLRSARRVCAGRPGVDLRLATARALEATGDREGSTTMAALLAEAPDRHGLRRELLRALERQGRYEEMGPHLAVLDEAGVAPAVEPEVAARLQRGLPPRYAERMDAPPPAPPSAPPAPEGPR